MKSLTIYKTTRRVGRKKRGKSGKRRKKKTARKIGGGK
jgi:hypothetical protein